LSSGQRLRSIHPHSGILLQHRTSVLSQKQRRALVLPKLQSIAHLRGLDLKGLRARWKSIFQRSPPDHLGRHLLFSVIAYRIQADRLGDLGYETQRLLDRTRSTESGSAMSARLMDLDQKRAELTPGTVLVREWKQQSQRVMVMADGFAWNGQTFDSLSKVAFAITGTRWNGPRFFGMRDKQHRSATEVRR
jgi:hypothetical protein